jgi:DNA-binding protein H-NS
MSIDDLWALHAELKVLLTAKISSEKKELDRRLAQLKGDDGRQADSVTKQRRSYPKVLPKYQNPAVPTETWSGRGKQPSWVKQQLKAGKTLADFAIRNP